ncbi:DUF3693 domain-containing protein [Aeromonas veronii]
MDSKTLLAAYMRAKNMTQLKEAAEELGFSNSYIGEVNKGFKQVTDETAIRMAEDAGLDPLEVIISLQAVRAKTPETKAAWYDALKKYYASTGAALAVGCMMITSAEGMALLTAYKNYLC